MSEQPEYAAKIEIPIEDWAIFASIAWQGYRSRGRGVVVLELEDDEDEGGAVAEVEITPVLYYLPAEKDVIRLHAEHNARLAAWLEGYDPERSLLLAIAHPVGIFYCLIDTPDSNPTPSQAHPPKDDDVREALAIQDTPVLRDWPELSGSAVAYHADVGRGTLVIEVPFPSEDEINAAIERALRRAERDFLRALREQAPAALSESRDHRDGFERRLHERWGRALDLFETILIYAREFGSEFANKYQAQAARDNDVLLTVLVRLHARACLTASEVLALLRTGHAAGAHARWRTLHEIASVSYFLRRFGPKTAEMYLEHEHVEAYKAAREYQQHCVRLGYEPYSQSEMDEFRRRYDDLLAKYGKDFGLDYGWAVDGLRQADPSFKGRATIAQIERAAEVEHWRPYYRMSSHVVHANPKGITFNLGLLEQGSLLLAGPSNAGLSDPGHSACISLSQVTTVLLGLKPNDFDCAMSITALHHFVKEAGEEFIEAHRRLNEEEAGRQSKSKS